MHILFKTVHIVLNCSEAVVDECQIALLRRALGNKCLWLKEVDGNICPKSERNCGQDDFARSVHSRFPWAIFAQPLESRLEGYTKIAWKEPLYLLKTHATLSGFLKPELL